MLTARRVDKRVARNNYVNEQQTSPNDSMRDRDIAQMISVHIADHLRQFEANMDARMGRYQQALRAEILEDIKRSLRPIEDELVDLKREAAGISDRVERQERRLASIESFPMPPINRPNRLYATDTHSVSRPHRVPVGYAG